MGLSLPLAQFGPTAAVGTSLPSCTEVTHAGAGKRGMGGSACTGVGVLVPRSVAVLGSLTFFEDSRNSLTTAAMTQSACKGVGKGIHIKYRFK